MGGGSVGHVDRGKRQVVLGLGMKGRGPDDLSVRTKVGVSVMWASEYLKIKKQNNNFEKTFLGFFKLFLFLF